MKSHSIFVAMLLALATAAASAGPLSPTSYSMPNGDGQASGGTYNYWDGSYTGAGSTTTDGAALSGGLGKLTDGIVSTSVWYNVSNNAGTGDYVGWFAPVTRNPVITFSFAGNPAIDSIAIQLDNTGAGGVFEPSAILIDGVSKSFSALAPGTVGSVSFTGLGLVGPIHTIEFDQAPSTWTFVSEISFSGSPTAVPEPATWALMSLGVVGLALRRRRA